MEKTLSRKFGWSGARSRESYLPLWAEARWVSPAARVTVVRDIDDNHVIDCAVEAGARLIVSGDRDLLHVGWYGAIEIINPGGIFGTFRDGDLRAGLAS